jgi:hypothetical protein
MTTKVRQLVVMALAGTTLWLTGCGSSARTATGALTNRSSTTAAPGRIGLSIASPADGASIKGNVVALDVHVTGVTIVKANGDTSGATGHYHVFIDRDPPAAGTVIPKEAGIVHTAENPISLTGLTTGMHRLVVVVGDGAHRRIGDAEAAVTVNVQGPALQASVPTPITAGQPVVITAQVQGVQLVEANGDTSGTTGHLHVFVDRDPTPAGQAVPKGVPGIIHSANTTIPLSGLTPGDHTVWVVLGNGAHVPFDPPVETKLTFTVPPA